MCPYLPRIYAAATVALLLSTAPALAEVLNFSADLTGAAEVPPNDSAGTGQVSADYDTEAKILQWNISYQYLTGPATAAHFHGPANPDETADPIVTVDLEPATAGAEAAAPAEAAPAEPPAAEAAAHLTGESTLTDQQAADLRAGRWYFNIHTAMYPDGELRGHLPPEED